MRIKMLYPGVIAATILAALVFLPKLTTSNVLPVSQASSHNHPHNHSQAKSIERIDGLPVRRRSGAFASPENLDELINLSTLIVIGKVNKNLRESEPLITRDAEGFISEAVSFTDMKVNKVFKGDANIKGQTIKIGQHVAILKDESGNEYISAVEGAQPFQKGRYLLFLQKANGVDAYVPLGLYFGRHNLDNTDNSEESIDSLSFQDMRKLVRQRFKDN